MFVFLLFMPEDLFYKSFLIIQYILGNKTKAIIFVDFCAIRFTFIKEKIVEIIYERLEIQS